MASRAQLARYRRLAEGTLAPLAEAKAAELTHAQEELVQWEELAATVADMAAHAAAAAAAAGGVAAGKPFKLLADVGAGFRMHARVAPADATSIFVHVGAGVYPQLWLPEAAALARGRLAALAASVAATRGALQQVRSDLAVAREALQQLDAAGGYEDDDEDAAEGEGDASGDAWVETEGGGASGGGGGGGRGPGPAPRAAAVAAAAAAAAAATGRRALVAAAPPR